MEGFLAAGCVQKLSYSLKIAKVPLCLLVAFSSLFGFLYAKPVLSGKAGYVFAAVLMLSCGSATLNSYQERGTDSLLQRTKNRPLVKRKISDTNALVQAALLIITGLTALSYFSDFKSFIAGLIAVVLYNFIYTGLKSRSIYAIIPGAISGAIPPYIGWLAAGGEVMSFRAMLPVLLLIFWQIPHFFLILLNHKLDYVSSIFPNLLKKLSETSLKRIFLSWITALAVTMLTFTVLPSGIGNLGRMLIVINAAVLFGLFCVQFLYVKQPNYSYLFKHLNLSIIIIMLVVCCGAVTI
jgi:protoheme IX farnesyltransferase